MGVLFLSITTHQAQAQYDTLLNRPFNERYPSLLALFEKFPSSKDSLGFLAETKSITNLAKAKGDKKLAAEMAAVQFRWFSAKKVRVREALESMFQRATESAKALDYAQVQAVLEFYFEEYLWEQNDYPIAIQHLEKAHELAEKLSGHDFYLKQEIAYQLGSKYYFLTDYTACIHYLNIALKDSNPRDSLNPLKTLYNTLGLAYLNQGKLDAARATLQKALDIAKLTNDQAWIGNLSGNLGHVYILQGEVEKGEALLRADKDISLSRGARNPGAGALVELAHLSFNKGKVELAEQQLDSAVAIFGNVIPFSRKESMFPLMSKLYAYRGQWKEAALYLDSSLLVKDSLASLDNAVQVLRLKQLAELQASKLEIAQNEVSIHRKTVQGYAMITGLLIASVAGLLVYRQKKRADHAKHRSDELLLNILPKNIAEELKATGASVAKKFEATTILFCDFKHFTKYSEEMAPEVLIQVLDSYFKAFDEVITALGLEKIKTVGDAYICASGLPAPDPQHAEKIVSAALKFQETMHESPAGWQLRIGIHSGSVVAGIVGIKKFAYDIWGDTVNTAARMEQGSEAGKINISQATYELVKHRFHCTYRGKLTVKHKGELDMYYVEGNL